MAHLKPISRIPMQAQEGNLTGLESLIILVVTVVFQSWDNFQVVIQNLQKFYSKTP